MSLIDSLHEKNRFQIAEINCVCYLQVTAIVSTTPSVHNVTNASLVSLDCLLKTLLNSLVSPVPAALSLIPQLDY